MICIKENCPPLINGKDTDILIEFGVIASEIAEKLYKDIPQDEVDDCLKGILDSALEQAKINFSYIKKTTSELLRELADLLEKDDDES